MSLSSDVQALLARLVAFDTVSDKTNLPLVEFVHGWLAEQGIEHFLDPNESGDKAALYATVGPKADGGVVLSGHTDVVSAEAQSWSGDPFALRAVDGRLVGRGACDMKGFDACALAALASLKDAPLRRPLHLLLSYDEETSCLGSLGVIERFGRSLPMPSLAIVGEPTLMRVVDAHKGVATFLTRVEGRAAHSAKAFLGADAVGVACDIGSEIGRLGRAYEERRRDERFDPPYSTFHVGIIRGGVARNILAEECRINWEFRGLPGVTAASALAEVEAFIDQTAKPRLTRYVSGPTIETTVEVDVPSLSSGPPTPDLSLILKLAGQAAPEAAPFASEAGHFQRAGMTTVLLGPGSIDQAHQPDEFIEEAELLKCLNLLGRLGDVLAC